MLLRLTTYNIRFSSRSYDSQHITTAVVASLVAGDQLCFAAVTDMQGGQVVVVICGTVTAGSSARAAVPLHLKGNQNSQQAPQPNLSLATC